MFIVWFGIKWLIPDISNNIEKLLEDQAQHINAIFYSEKLEKQKQAQTTREEHNYQSQSMIFNETQPVETTVKKRKNKKKNKRDELIEDSEADTLRFDALKLAPLAKKYEYVNRSLINKDSTSYDDSKILNI